MIFDDNFAYFFFDKNLSFNYHQISSNTHLISSSGEGFPTDLSGLA